MTNVHQFLEKLKEVSLEEDKAMVLFDLTEPLTSSDFDLAKKITTNFLQQHYAAKPVETGKIIELLEMGLDT